MLGLSGDVSAVRQARSLGQAPGPVGRGILEFATACLDACAGRVQHAFRPSGGKTARDLRSMWGRAAPLPREAAAGPRRDAAGRIGQSGAIRPGKRLNRLASG